MTKKIMIFILSFFSFPIFSKNILPNVQGNIRIDDTEIIFTFERLLFSYPFYITGYEIYFDESSECTKVYISFIFTNFKTKKRIDVKNEKTGKREIRIQRTGKLKSSNLLFFYKDTNRITELTVVKNIQ